MGLLYITIGDYITKTFNSFSNNDALVFVDDGSKYTYKDLIDSIDDTAENLLRFGVKKGEHVGLIVHNSPKALIAFFAIIKIGAVCVNINQFSTREEIDYILKKSDTNMLICDKEIFIENNFIDATNLKLRLIIEEVVQKHFVQGETKGILKERMDVIQKSIDPSDLAAILFTSGSTGMAKGVMFNHTNILKAILEYNEYFQYSDKDAILAALPISHIFGGIYSCIFGLFVGSKILLMKKFHTKPALEVMEKEKCTVIHGVPTMYKYILNEYKSYDISSLRIAMVSGAVSSEKLIKEIFEELKVKEVRNCFGQTETLGVTFGSITNVSDPTLKSTGRRNRHVQIKIADVNTDEPLPANMDGELCVKSSYCMMGYYGDKEKTQEIIKDGWVHTGDIASLDENGYLYIKGRIRDIIIRGGENIYPSDIEGQIIKHEKIENAIVVGVDDDIFGEEAFIYIKLVNNEVLTKEDIFEYLDKRIAKYKMPKYIEFIKEIPLTSTKKIQRKELQKKANKLIKSKK